MGTPLNIEAHHCGGGAVEKSDVANPFSDSGRPVGDGGFNGGAGEGDGVFGGFGVEGNGGFRIGGLGSSEHFTTFAFRERAFNFVVYNVVVLVPYL